MTKPDLMVELAEVVRKVGLKDKPLEAWASSYNFILVYHAEIEAMEKDAAIGKAYRRWYELAKGYSDVAVVGAHDWIMADAAMHNSARER